MIRPIRYWLDRRTRALAMQGMRQVTAGASGQPISFHHSASKQRHFALVPKGNGIRGSMFDLQGRLLITNTTISGLVGSLGLATEQCLPSLVLARIEPEQGIRRIDNLVGRDQSFNGRHLCRCPQNAWQAWRAREFLGGGDGASCEGVRASSLWVPKSENCLPTSRSIVSPHPGCF